MALLQYTPLFLAFLLLTFAIIHGHYVVSTEQPAAAFSLSLVAVLVAAGLVLLWWFYY